MPGGNYPDAIIVEWRCIIHTWSLFVICNNSAGSGGDGRSVIYTDAWREQQMVRVSHSAYLPAGDVLINLHPQPCRNSVKGSANGFTTKRFIREKRGCKLYWDRDMIPIRYVIRRGSRNKEYSRILSKCKASKGIKIRKKMGDLLNLSNCKSKGLLFYF